jgi:ribonuclease T2
MQACSARAPLQKFHPLRKWTACAISALVVCLVLAACSGGPGPQRTLAAAPGESLSDFDYFVLSLSWSSDYCATTGSSDPQECTIGRKLGFVLHGLWPQNNQGYPANCASDPLPADVKARFPGLYPNDSLAYHEWLAHGTCSGLTAAVYLALTQRIKQSVVIAGNYQSPAAAFRATVAGLKQDFVQANPGFTPTDFEVLCSGSGLYLKELYVCFSREGQPTACGADVHKSALKSCQSPDFVVRNTR